MEEVFNSGAMIGKRLAVKKVIALRDIEEDRAIQVVKRQMAMMLADTIMQDQTFFQSYADEPFRVPMITYEADVIVLTQEEYLQLHRKAFKQGVEHAYGFMPAVRNPA